MVAEHEPNSATIAAPVAAPIAAPIAAMSIDVEDWFQVENLKAAIDPATWDQQQRRVVRNTDRMLELMHERAITCTCFILGWVAEREPQLIKRIADAGHEIACHGYGHDLIYNLERDAFREDIRRAKAILEDQTGARVVGYRAPSFSITDWAVDILAEEGFEYDSSAFPTIAHDRYGKLSGMDAADPIVQIRDGFWEICVSTLKLGKRGVPWGGGGYFRLIPYPVFRLGVSRILSAGQPYVFYIHPWEIDAGQPRVAGLKRSHAFRHYVNLVRCETRWASLLSDFECRTMAELLSAWRADNRPDAVGAGPRV
jgi:polysaccharide deacetylase family protein (PEP-CTERM system associated)